MRTKQVLFLFLFLAIACNGWAQQKFLDNLSSRAVTDAQFPAFGDQNTFGPGFGGFIDAEYRILPFLSPFLYGGFTILPVEGLDTLTIAGGGIGAGLYLRPVDRFLLRLDALAGLYNATWRDYNASGISLGVRAEAGYRISPVFTISAGAGFTDYLGGSAPLLTAFSAGLSFSFNFGGFRKDEPKVDIKPISVEPVFPVFYSYYDENSFGNVSITNGEEADIQDITVSFLMADYMSQAKVCGTFKSLDKNRTLDIPLYAIFNDGVLSLTETSKARAEIIVDYRLLGSKRRATLPITMTMYHRNAMNWADDRKAAAFVSPMDPAALWFARFTSSIVRDRIRGNINQNMQFAMGIFETLNLFGINYVIDPNSSYVDLSSEAESVDYLQYPYQTLLYRGGDCDDLSILYSSLLEAVGIETAFITIPGHIFMAFSSGLSEAEAKNFFYDPSMLIYDKGEAWIPVEITMIKEGFLKAWRIGAKEWMDNAKTGKGAIYRMHDSWIIYPAVGIPDVNPRFSLPEDTDTITTFDMAINRFVARELEQRVSDLLIVDKDKTQQDRENELGILFGTYGLLPEAWKYFSSAAKAGLPEAWTNLGNIAFLRKDYELGLTYYDWALNLNPEDSTALLGKARCYYELENLNETEKIYSSLKKQDPELASEFTYLASIFGGEGRAWSFSDRLTSIAWIGPGAVAAGDSQEGVINEPIRLAAAEKMNIEEKAAPGTETQDAGKADIVVQPAPAEAETVMETEPIAPAAAPEAEIAQPAPLIDSALQTTAVEVADTSTDSPAAPAPDTETASPIAETIAVQAVPEDKTVVQPAADVKVPPPVIAEAPPPDKDLAPKKPPIIAGAPPPDKDLAPKTPPATAASPPAEKAPAAANTPPVIADAPPPDKDLVQNKPPEIAKAPQAVKPEQVIKPEKAVEQEEPVQPEKPGPSVEPGPQVAIARTTEEQLVRAEEVPVIPEEPVVNQESLAETPVNTEPRIIAAESAATALVTPVSPETPALEEPTIPSTEPAAEIAFNPDLPIQDSPTIESPTVGSPTLGSPTLGREDIYIPWVPLDEAPIPDIAKMMAGLFKTGVEEKTVPFAGVSPKPILLADSFEKAFPALGAWSVKPDVAIQEDPKQYFAKLVIPIVQAGKPVRYSFKARSLGAAWVGLGVHLFVDRLTSNNGYGAGESLLVWITWDSVNNKDGKTHLQLYRSFSSTDMRLEKDVTIPESIFLPNTYRIDFDPRSGKLTVFVNGEERLGADGYKDLVEGSYLILRSLDSAAFSDFKAEELP